MCKLPPKILKNSQKFIFLLLITMNIFRFFDHHSIHVVENTNNTEFRCVFLVQATKQLNKKLDLRSKLLAIRVLEPKDFESNVSFSQIVPIFRKIANENFCNFLVIYKSKDKSNSSFNFTWV